jgi:predicted  nucleic acid-binding Zn-ribbon protein
MRLTDSFIKEMFKSTLIHSFSTFFHICQITGNEAEVAAVSLETASKLSKETDKNKALELTVTNMKEEVEKQEEMIDRLNKDLKEAWSQTSLAEKQYDGLKETIRRLQNENEELTKSNDEFVNRIVQEKEKSVEEMNSMMQLNEEMKKKIDMLSAVQKQEKKKFLWSAIGVQSKQKKEPAVEEKNTRKFGAHGVIVPTAPKTAVRAHQTPITCMRLV